MVSICNVTETFKFYFQWLLDLVDIHLGDHSFSRQANFSVELVFFIPPDTQMCVCVSGGKKCQFFGEFCVRTEWMIHQIIFLPNRSREESKENNLENISAGLFMIFLHFFLFQSSWFLDDQTIVIFYFVNIHLRSSIVVYS